MSIPIPPDADLRDFHFYPLEVRRLLDSALSASSAEVFRVAVLSWCVAWHQLPAGSLPNDDAALARLMGFGRDLKGWKKVRAAGGMRGWEVAEDGLLYHPVVTAKVIEALAGKRKQRTQTEAARLARLHQRQGGGQDSNRVLNSHATDHATSSVTDSVTESKLTVDSRQLREDRGQGITPAPAADPQAEVQGADPSTDRTPIDPEQAWRLERLEPWARALAPILGNKLGPKNWQAWKRLIVKHGADRVVTALESLAPDQRWPTETETELLAMPEPRRAPTVSPRKARAAALVTKHGKERIEALTKIKFRDADEAIEALTDNPKLADMVEKGAA